MNSTDILQKRLAAIVELADQKKIEQEFSDLAKALFNNFEIKKGDDTYEFVEIEFYLYNAKHKDAITYPRMCIEGQWFFHQSGVDISFKSKKAENEKGFVGGGILIRSIENKNDTKLICGPINCMSVLFDQFNAFGHDGNFPIIQAKVAPETRSFGQCKRYVNLSYKPNDEKEKLKEKLKQWPYKDEKDMKEFINKPYRYYRKDITDWKTEKGTYAARPNNKNYQPKGFEQ